MYLSTITLKNFRKYAYDGANKHGITVNFHKGLNALIGENDSGKSAIIDAIKLVLQTQSGEFTRVMDEDLYISATGEIATEFSIDCIFEGFEINEAKNFVEWLSFEKDKTSGAVFYKLFLHYRAWRENGRIYTELKAGDVEDGISLDGKARELLKCVYLRPLRDAQKEMHSGRNSRISQILFSHPLFSNKEDNALVTLIMQANEGIEKYFLEEEGLEILGKIRSTLTEFLDEHASKDASIKTSEMRLKSILESLSLVAPEVQPGLGVHNLLFIAAELLLLNSDTNGSLKLAVIEELEAHLHPQAQLRLISYLQREYNNSGVQVIVSTHSSILASKINIKNLILLKNDRSFNLSAEYTGLEKGDYLFLQRFLDSTKSNLFFAKGIIMVEGDAESLLIPTLADVIGINLEKHGISIVNVGGTGFFRYSRIFLRKDGSAIDIPISIITDCDIEPDKNDGEIDQRETETTAAIVSIQHKYTVGRINAFVAPKWTFEYSVAFSCLRDMLYESILQAKKIENSDQYALTATKIEEIEKNLAEEKAKWSTQEPCVTAYQIYHDTMLNKGDPALKTKATSKAIVAQCLASNLRWAITEIASAGEGGTPLPKERMFDLDLFQTHIDEAKRVTLAEEIEKDPYLSYLILAIKHAAGIEG